MGVTDVGTVTVELVAAANANLPCKERRFTKVQVPAIYTRGRWRCCDYPDEENPPPQIADSPIVGFSGTAKRIMAREPPGHIKAIIEQRPTQAITSHAIPLDNASSTIVVTSVRPAPGMTMIRDDPLMSSPTGQTFEIIRQVVNTENDTDSHHSQKDSHPSGFETASNSGQNEAMSGDDE
ncbi:unnamed protein product, partial [Mesorhabditis belari]|uniref:Uncharacterized protein n=1 Tax=Mesorhabditis belari TaxID=2138241 RepID=A0AAF3FP99_9BILA